MRSYLRRLMKTGRWTLVFVTLVAFWLVKG